MQDTGSEYLADSSLKLFTPLSMLTTIRSLRVLANKLYGNAERTVTAKLIQHTGNAIEQARIKMLFDFIFFYCILISPIFFTVLYVQDYTNLMVNGTFYAIFALCLFLMKKGVTVQVVGTIAALNTMIIPMLSSFANDLDVSPLYAIPWLMSCLLGYFVVNLRTALALGVVLFLYLVLVAFMKIQNIPVLLPATYSMMDKYLVTPFFMMVYLVLCLRVWGVYYRNITRLEHQRAMEEQQQFSALINQNLTKQFLLVKGLSRSGKSEYMEGNIELLDACFTEIEKQCDTAIHYLDGPKTEK